MRSGVRNNKSKLRFMSQNATMKPKTSYVNFEKIKVKSAQRIEKHNKFDKFKLGRSSRQKKS